MKKMNAKNKGFTILEILVVLAVLAILIGMAVPRIKGMQEQANIAKVKSELKTIQTAIESYYINKNNIYPDSSNNITKDILADDTIPQILSGVLYDPFAPAGTEYIYIKSDNGQYYVIYSVGLDGLPNGVVITDEGSCFLTAEDAVDNIWVTNGADCIEKL